MGEASGPRGRLPTSLSVLNRSRPTMTGSTRYRSLRRASLVEGLSLACDPSVTEQAKQAAGQVLRPARPLGGEAPRASVTRIDMKPCSGPNHDRRRRTTSMSSPAARVGARTPLRRRSRPTSRSKSCRAASGGRSSSIDAGRSERGTSWDSAPGPAAPRYAAGGRPVSALPRRRPGRAGAERVPALHPRSAGRAGRRWPGRSCRAKFLPTPACGRVPGSRVGQRLAELGVAVGPADVLRRAGTLARDDSGPLAAAADQFDLVLPAVAEVVKVGETSGQRPKRHACLVSLIVEGVGVRHPVA